MLKKILSTHFNNQQINISILIFRVTIALLMMPHGYNKLIHYADKQDSFMPFMGLSGAISLALVIFAELLCSVFLMIGLCTRLALLPLIITMLVAIFHAHHGDIFGDGQQAFLYLLCYTILFITSAGKYSVDSFFAPHKAKAEIPVEIKNKREDRSVNFEVGGEG